MSIWIDHFLHRQLLQMILLDIQYHPQIQSLPSSKTDSADPEQSPRDLHQFEIGALLHSSSVLH